MPPFRIQLEPLVLVTANDIRSQVIPLVQGDTRSDLPFLFSDVDGLPLDITSVTPRLHLRLKGQPEILNPGSAAELDVDDALNGVCRYEYKAGDTATPGMLEGELSLDYGAGVVQIMDEVISIRVRKSIG